LTIVGASGTYWGVANQIPSDDGAGTLEDQARGGVPPSLQAHALDNLRFIRETMARAGSFTAVSGWGQVTVGLVALATAFLASRAPTPEVACRCWLGAAGVSLVVAACAIALKARATRTPLFSAPATKFASCFAPPLLAGAILTIVLYRAALFDSLPGVWLLLFGVAVMTGGAFSVRVVPIMGICFMALSVIAFAAPASLGNLLLAAGFGVVHVVFGIIIAVKYGG
jgi:hypothetical protein